MREIKLVVENPRPFFAEVPYYLWGMVNYDSEGDCKHPTDRMWSWLEITHRDTDEYLELSSKGTLWTISGDEPNLSRLTMFLIARSDAKMEGEDFQVNMGGWNHASGMDRANRVAEEFSTPSLKPFDNHLFWGSWKWIGWFATEFTWVGRWIMLSVLKNDPRGVPLCIDWLKHGTFSEEQSKALRYALNYLTGESFSSDDGWVRWYNGGIFRKGAKSNFPEPEIDNWLEELKKEYGDSQP